MDACTDRRHRIARRLQSLVLIGIGLFGTPAISYGNVFETDDRRPITTADQLGFVGVIACGDTGRLPTASLIALPERFEDRQFDIVLSVAHAFYTRQGRKWSDCAFLNGGDSANAASIKDLIVGTTTPGDGWNEDWAVALIDRQATHDDERPHPAIIRYEDLMAKREAGGTILLAGHNGEQLPLLLSTDCGPRRKTSGHYNLQDSRVFNHDCDMMAGWSGGPLMLRHEGETLLIGINATEYNSVVHQVGWPFDGRFNPNTAIRISPDILSAIESLTEKAKGHGPPPPTITCEVSQTTTC